MSLVHFLRVVASFCLLGAVVAGTIGGAFAPPSRDLVHMVDGAAIPDVRLIGLILGGIVGFFVARNLSEPHAN
ncbi:MAG TPA: hypothetical protein VEH76_04510 [Methylocystis sp.]|nr:hypothetical protein [Methylocystis sp.]